MLSRWRNWRNHRRLRKLGYVPFEEALHHVSDREYEQILWWAKKYEQVLGRKPNWVKLPVRNPGITNMGFED